MAIVSKPKFTALGASSHNAKNYRQKRINEKLLESFVSPTRDVARDRKMWEHISVGEFTCLCPITGQPDFAIIEIFYRPATYCVESKSLKLYLGSFRNVGTFHEAVATRVHDDLRNVLKPLWLLVVGRFTPRGGIPFQPRVYSGDVPRELLYRM